MKVTSLLLIAFAFAALILLAGCTVENNISVGCCKLDTTDPTNPTCDTLSGEDVSPEVTVYDTDYCNESAGTCDVTIQIALTQPPKLTETQKSNGCTASGYNIYCPMTVPICSDRTSTCISENCHALACGPARYEPTPVPSLSDSTKFSSDSQRKKGLPSGASAAKGKSGAENLYNTQCFMLPANTKLQSFLQNSKGSAIDTFRFGVGNSFDEFDKYRFMFPYSDAFCNMNPYLEGTKDRYMNYMLTPDEFAEKLSSQDEFDKAVDGEDNTLTYTLPWFKIESESFCPASVESPFLGPMYSGADYVGYKFSRSVPYESSTNPGTGTATTPYGTELDKNFYVNFLPMIYDEEMTLTTQGEVPIPAPFECSTGMECSSGLCSTQTYGRGLCKSDDTWVPCSCFGEARYCYGGSQHMEYPTSEEGTPFGKPKTAEDLKSYISQYIGSTDGTGRTFFVKNKPQIQLIRGCGNPSCDWTDSPEGIEHDIRDVLSCKLSLDGASADCSVVPVNTYDINCTPVLGGKYECGPNAKRRSTDYLFTCTYDGNKNMNGCQAANTPFNAADCTETVNGNGALTKVFCNYVRGSATVSCNPMNGRCSMGSYDSDKGYCKGSFPPTPAGSQTCPTGTWNNDTKLCDNAYIPPQDIYDTSCSIIPKHDSALSLAGCTYSHSGSSLSCVYSGVPSWSDCKKGLDSLGDVYCKQNNIASNGKITNPALESVRFPQDIQFFGSLKPYQYKDSGETVDYVGYTLMANDDFKLTDFYQQCELSEGAPDSPQYVLDPNSYDSYGLIKGTWYDIAKFTFMDSGGGNDEALSAFYGGTVFRPPLEDPSKKLDPGGATFIADLPQIIGTQSLNTDMDCHLFGDTNACNVFTPTYIFLKAKNGKIGKCDVDTTTGIPVTKSFGWCEPCSYSTMAKQTVTSASNWYYTQENRVYRDYSATKNYSNYTNAYKANTMRSIPDAFYLVDRTNTYLKEGIWPVIDLTSSSNWGSDGVSLWSSLFDDPATGSMQNGPTMVIVDSIETDYGLSEAQVVLTPDYDKANNDYRFKADITTTTSSGSLEVKFGEKGGGEFGQGQYRNPTGTSSVTVGGILFDFSNSYFYDDEQYATVNVMASKGGTEILDDGVTLSSTTQTIGGLLYGSKGESTTQSELKAAMGRFASRKAEVESVCGKCMIGFRITNTGSGATGDAKVTQNVLTVRVLNDSSAYDTSMYGNFNATDFIDFSFHPAEFTVEDASLCDASTGKAASDMFSTIFLDLQSLGKRTLIDSQKLSLVSDFYLGSNTGSACWDDSMKQSFTSYIFAKQKLLSTSGMLGLIYSASDTFTKGTGTTTDTFGNSVSYEKTDEDYFCPFQSGSQWHVADTPVTVYSKAYVAESVTCEQCADIDVLLGTCDTACLNGVDCTEPSGSGAEGPWKCPSQSVPLPCTPCNQSSGYLDCKFFRNDGSTDESTYAISELSDLSPDIIASIPSPSSDVCCLEDESGNYTYVKQTSAGKNVAPMVFSLVENVNADCGVTDLSSLDPNMCGSVMPIKNYRVECVSIPPPTAGFVFTPMWSGSTGGAFYKGKGGYVWKGYK